DLLRTDDARTVARHAVLLEEFLTRERGRGLELRFTGDGRTALLHGHCHQKALVGTAPTVAALRWAGFRLEEVDSGCCGMAGAFGFGFPPLGTPLLALFLDVKTAVAVLVVPNLVMDGIQARRRGGLAATVRRLRPLLLSGAAGTVLGTAALAELGAQTVTL